MIFNWPKWFQKGEKGSFNPSRPEGINPLSPKREMHLRNLYHDCHNVRDLLDEIDRINAMLKEQDHEIWRKINKPRGKE